MRLLKLIHKCKFLGDIDMLKAAVDSCGIAGTWTEENKTALNQLSAVSPHEKRRIFIVHGHDAEARDQLELILMRLGLQPFILQNSDGGGLCFQCMHIALCL